MSERSKIEALIEILKKDSRRALKMKVRGFPRPYYCSLLLRDLKWTNTWSSSGSMYRKRSDHTRNVYCDIRVGRYRYDQVADGGLHDNDDEQESYTHTKVPIDDTCHDGLRMAIWRLSESKFREALSDFNSRESSRLSTVDPNRRLASFAPLPAIKKISYKRFEKIDEEKWVRFCKRASKWLSELKHLSANYVEFDASQETKIFVNTENRIIVQQSQVFSIIASLRKLTNEGFQIEQELVLNCGTQKELFDMKTFKRRALERYNKLLELIDAKKIHSFSGPVLLSPKASGLLFHEAIGHRMEGSRLLSNGEGKTFKGQIGKKILNVDLDIYDDPRIKSFGGKRCIGAYEFDDEGTKATRADLIKSGKIAGFLNTRSQLPVRGMQQPNGHARNKQHQRPISRMGVTVVRSKDGESWDELKAHLIREIIEQRKPFGLIVYQTSGGETDTTSYDFQAFSGDISYARLVYPDGREEVVRGVDFVGTPLQALHNIVAVGDEMVMDNHYCGAESGFIPVTTIAPAILLNNLELQAKDEALVTQYILPRPKL
jgi:TldD protein